MSPAFVKLESQLLGLPIEVRAKLAECLLASLDSAEFERDEAFWLDEVETRASAHKADPASGIPAETAFRDALGLIKPS